jgi:membrane-associated phospholipid phosphatase
MPVLWLDRQIDFQPGALPLYFSLWLYVSLLPAFFGIRRELLAYGLAMTAMCVCGLTVFYFWPSGAPVPDIDWTRHPEIHFLKNIDAAGNACPSLHVATAFFSGIWFHHHLRRFGGPWWVLSLNWIWCAGIVYSTLAIRQHVSVDVFAGLALGGLFALLSLHYRVAGSAAHRPASLPA